MFISNLTFCLHYEQKRIVNVVIINTSLKKTRRSNSAICYGVVPNVWSTTSIVLWGKTIFLRFDFSCPIWKAVLSIAVTLKVESVQDFLSKLDMKPCVHLVEISIFSLNHAIIRLTKIMNNLLKHLKIRTFKVIFLCQKLVESFQKKLSMKNIWLFRNPTSIKIFFLKILIFMTLF